MTSSESGGAANKSAARSSGSGGSSQRGLWVAACLLGGAMLVGGAILAKTVLFAPTPAEAKPSTPNVKDRAGAVEAGLEAAASYQREKKYAEASAILAKLAEQSPNDRSVRLAWAQALMGQEKWDKAYEQYAIALLSSGVSNVAMRDTAAAAKIQRDPAVAQLNFEAGTCAMTAGFVNRAEEHYWMAQVLDAVEPRYPLYLGMASIKKGEDEQATASLLRAVKLNPDLAEAWGTLGELALKNNRLGLAAQHLQKAIDLQPNVSRWRIAMARVHNREAEPEKALALLNALPLGEAGSSSVLTLKAECYGLLKRPADAAAMFVQASKADPSNAEYMYQAAMWLDRSGDSVKALPLAQSASMMGHEGAKELVEKLSAKPGKQ